MRSTLFTLLVFVVSATSSFAQGEFELRKDLGGNSIAYADSIPVDSLSTDAFNQAFAYVLEEMDFKITEIETKTNGRKFEYIFNVEGQKSELGDKYYYRFSSEIYAELTDKGVYITCKDFKKKSSPGEPGMTMEMYIDNYEPKISSEKSRMKADARLDEIEKQIDEQILKLLNAIEVRLEKAAN